MLKIDPLTLQLIQKFCRIRRSYYSLVGFTLAVVLSLFAELWVNSRALVVYYQGSIRLPTYGAMIPGEEFGLPYDYEANYRELKQKLAESGDGGWVLMPIVPWDEYESDLPENEYPPFAPSLARKHFLGTDIVGRDILARLTYGFRTAIVFSILLLVSNYLLGVTIGCLMGYFSGWFDLVMQRAIEIWTNVPFLYVIMIISSIIVPNFMMLVAVMVIFGWTSLTWYMRTAVYKEKVQEYALAAKAMGASIGRILFVHILPNTISLIVTFIPFSISGGIVALTSLDYLGFGLPAPTPSWGDLLKQGMGTLEAQWIIISVVTAMVIVLTMITFIGEGIREAFDPRRHSVYE